MCRLYGFRATEPTKVECTLVRAQNALLFQSRADRRGKQHADGWGIACYEDGEPDVWRRRTAAFETPHFSTTAERIYSRTVVAHVRRATVARASDANTHPFVHGPWTFAHNGTVRPFERVGPILQRETHPELQAHRLGSTDSEQAFYWLLTRLADAGQSPHERCVDLNRLAEVLESSVHDLATLCDREGADRPAELNFVLSDGQILVATRWHNSLAWVSRDGVHDCEICGIPHIRHDPSVSYRAVVLASEPITHETWLDVPDGAVVVVDRDARATVRVAKTTV